MLPDSERRRRRNDKTIRYTCIQHTTQSLDSNTPHRAAPRLSHARSRKQYTQIFTMERPSHSTFNLQRA